MSAIKSWFGRHIAIRQRFSAILLTGLIISLICIAGYFSYKKDAAFNEIEQLAYSSLNSKYELLTNDIDSKKRDLRFLHNTPAIQGIINASQSNNRTKENEWRQQLSSVFKSYVESNQDILQVRFIGKANNGKELVRVDRHHGRIYVYPRGKLQEKGNRQYFTSSAKLAPNEIYISEIDLNIEHGKFEYPYILTYRLAEAVFDKDNQFFGTVIINVNAKYIIEVLSEKAFNSENFYLIDSENNIISSPENFNGKTFSAIEKKQWNNAFESQKNNKKSSIVINLKNLRENLNFTKTINLSRPSEGRRLILSIKVSIDSINNTIKNDTLFASLVILMTLVIVLTITYSYQSYINGRLNFIETKFEFEAIVNGSSDAIITMDKSGFILSWNQAARQIFGFGAKAAKGSNIFNLLSIDDENFTQAMIQDAFNGDKIKPLDITTTHQTGKKINISVTLSPIASESGKISGVASIMRDITKQKIIESQINNINESLESQVLERTKELELAKNRAQDANKAKDRFVANISHEIRTPMNAIIGLAYLLSRQNLPNDSVDMAKKIHSSGKSLLRIINDILDFSKIEADKLEIESTPFLLSDVLDNLATIISTAAGDKNIELIIGPTPMNANFLIGDPLRLEQVLINLSSNAIKFTESGDVIIKTTLIDDNESESTIRFSITDTGPGIPPEKQKTIFNAFSQADSSITRNFGGTGLGLSICKKLIHQMGGDLQLRSTVGHGSEFYFELIFKHSRHEAPSLPQMAHQNILIADDHEIARTLLAKTVDSLGWSHNSVESGEKAVKVFSSVKDEGEKFDIILMDWRMPGVDGLEAASLIKAQASEHPPIVIMVTAHDKEKLKQEPNHALIDCVLTKPVTSSCLYNAVLDIKNNRGEIQKKFALVHTKRLNQIHVLVVDDSQVNRDVAQSILEAEGAKVDIAENGYEAIKIMSAAPDIYDIVLMDIQMPKMDGYTATKEIRKTQSLKNIPIIALTAGAFQENKSEAIESGMNDYLSKPFDVEQLISTILRLTTNQPPTQKSNTINFEKALIIWKTHEEYAKQLITFTKNHEGDADIIENLERKGEHSKGQEVCHKLKGAAGSLYLEDLAEQAKLTEQHFDNGTYKETNPSTELRDILEQTIEAIHLFINGHPLDQQSPEPNSSYTSRIAIDRMLEALESDSQKIIEDEMARCACEIQLTAYNDLTEHISNFDYEKARSLLLSLKSSISNNE